MQEMVLNKEIQQQQPRSISSHFFIHMVNNLKAHQTKGKAQKKPPLGVLTSIIF